jgi:hypothetical protein
MTELNIVKLQRFLLAHPRWLALWRIMLTVIGHVVFFWMRPQITKRQIDECYRRLKPGDVIGVYSRRYLTGLFLPKGKWCVEHSAICIREGWILEAVTPRSRIIPLRQFLKPYDRVVIGRPTLNVARIDERAGFVNAAWYLGGRPYDVAFGKGRKAVYCHELVAESLRNSDKRPVKSGPFWLFDDIADACENVEEIKP